MRARDGSQPPRAAGRGRGDRWTSMAMLGAATALLLAGCGGTSVTPSQSPTPAATATAVPTATPLPSTAPLPPTTDVDAYVAVQDGDIVPVDLATDSLGTPLPTGTPPGEMVVLPDGETAYMVEDSAITPVDLTTRSVGSPIPVPVGSAPTALAITPDGATGYASVAPGGGAAGFVVPITLATGSLGSQVPVGVDPVAMIITPDGRTAYAVNLYAGTLTPIALPTDTPGAPIAVGGQPSAIAIAPSGAVAYVLSGGSDGGSITPVTLAENPAQDVVGAAISSAALAGDTAIAITPEGSSAFVVGPDGASQIALPAGRVLWSSRLAAFTAVAISPDGRTALLASSTTSLGANTLTVVSVATSQTVESIPLDAGPVSVAYGPPSGSA